MAAATPEPPPAPTRGVVAWALYDWANSPFTTLIITFVFSVYFGRAVVGDEVQGQVLWGYAIGVSGIIVALLSPVLGAIADAGGPRKPGLLVFTAFCVVGSAMLWWAEPDSRFILWVMVWIVVANVAFEFGIVFNNAMLPDLVPLARLGRWSGWAWGLGYFGGLAALALALFAFVQAQSPWFGLDKEAAEHVRIVGPLVAVWFVLFSWPLFVFTPDRKSSQEPLAQTARAGLATLGATLRNIRAHRNVALFLVARLIYADGLVTVFSLGGIFAAGVFGMSFEQVLIFGILLNLTAGLGAVSFAWLDDWLGSKRTIAFSLVGLLVTAAGAVAVTDVTWFWIFGSALGVFVGPAQAASRSMLARLAPAELRTEFFGLYAFSGKATAFIGPTLASTVTAATASQRWGLATVLIFFLTGLVLLMLVREPARA